MKLTGKCKEDFEKWFFKNSERADVWFPALPFSMQYGVYVDFFDSVGKKCAIHWNAGYRNFELYIGNRFFSNHDTRHEARIKAIEKANEIYNEV